MRIGRVENTSFTSRVKVPSEMSSYNESAIKPLVKELQDHCGNDKSISQIRMTNDDLVVLIEHEAGKGKKAHQISIHADRHNGLPKAVANAIQQVKKSTIKALKAR